MPPQLDHISSLPEELIIHILSFLPPRAAVTTSILSKKFYPLWRSLSVINLTDQDAITGEILHSTFTTFVYTLLMLRDPKQPITKFTLKLESEKTREVNTDTWVSHVIRQGVQHLELHMRLVHMRLGDDYFCGLAIGIFRCRTLVVLKLSGFQPNAIDVSHVDLPLLRVLHLDMIELTCEECIPKLLSGCPILEDFKATNVQLMEDYSSSEDPEEFKILTKLIRAEIHVIDQINFPLEVLHNAQYLTLHIDKVSPNYNNTPTFYNLTKMKLTFDKVYKWQWLIGVLSHCPKLQILTLDIESYGSWKEYDDVDWVYPEFVPECVSLNLKKCTIQHYEGTKGDLQFARYILQNASVLQTMRICNARSGIGREKMEEALSLCEKHSEICHFFLMIAD